MAPSRSRSPDERKSEGEPRAPLHPSDAVNDAYLRLAALDVACLLAAAMMVRSWRKRKARPPIIAAGFLIVLAVVASALVMLGVPSGMVVGPTFIFALLVVMYTARLERKLSSTRR